MGFEGLPEPNLFRLSGKGVQIRYQLVRTGESFHYQDDERDVTFTQDDIRSLESEIGRLHTVTLQVVPDLGEITLSLLLPSINLGGSEQSFETFAIRTTVHSTSIGGPKLLRGPLQTYEILSLQGTATQVD